MGGGGAGGGGGGGERGGGGREGGGGRGGLHLAQQARLERIRLLSWDFGALAGDFAEVLPA